MQPHQIQLQATHHISQLKCAKAPKSQHELTLTCELDPAQHCLNNSESVNTSKKLLAVALVDVHMPLLTRQQIYLGQFTNSY